MYSYGILYIAIFACLLTPALATPTPEPSQLTLTIETYGGKGLEDLQCMGWLCAATPPPCWEYPDGPWVTKCSFLFGLNCTDDSFPVVR